MKIAICMVVSVAILVVSLPAVSDITTDRSLESILFDYCLENERGNISSKKTFDKVQNYLNQNNNNFYGLCLLAYLTFFDESVSFPDMEAILSYLNQAKQLCTTSQESAILDAIFGTGVLMRSYYDFFYVFSDQNREIALQSIRDAYISISQLQFSSEALNELSIEMHMSLLVYIDTMISIVRYPRVLDGWMGKNNPVTYEERMVAVHNLISLCYDENENIIFPSLLRKISNEICTIYYQMLYDENTDVCLDEWEYYINLYDSSKNVIANETALFGSAWFNSIGSEEGFEEYIRPGFEKYKSNKHNAD